MAKALNPLRGHSILYYLNDIFIAGKSWHELKRKLIMVLEALRKAGLTLKLEKCQFWKNVNF